MVGSWSKQAKRPWKRLCYPGYKKEQAAGGGFASTQARHTEPDFLGKNQLQKRPMGMATGGSGTGISSMLVQHILHFQPNSLLPLERLLQPSVSSSQKNFFPLLILEHQTSSINTPRDRTQPWHLPELTCLSCGAQLVPGTSQTQGRCKNKDQNQPGLTEHVLSCFLNRGAWTTDAKFLFLFEPLIAGFWGELLLEMWV